MKTLNIPNNAPFSDTQRAWLTGFFAGMCRHKLPSTRVNQSANTRILTILYGSQTGTSESVAEDAANVAKAHGLKPIVKSMDAVELSEMATIEYLLIVTSTYGEGEMPDNAQVLWDAIISDNAPRFENTQYAILALGDTSYDLFCQAGKDWDKRLEILGGNRVYQRIDCDVDFEVASESWIKKVIPLMADGIAPVIDTKTLAKEKSQYNRQHPLLATMILNKIITGKASSKETRHYEISIADSNLTYEAGDALGMIPTNCPELVNAIINAIGCNGNEQVTVKDASISLQTALHSHFEIKLPSKELLIAIASYSENKVLAQHLNAEDKTLLSDYLWGRDSLDLLLATPSIHISATDFIALLKPLQHRAYSIASSYKLYPDQVHLTVASVRYQRQGRDHKGVCSTYLADRVQDDTEIKIFFMPNKNFRVPEDDNVPMIMVGPGTGIAPFRAFLQERQVRKAKGQNWLFFGDRNKTTDFIYQQELEAMQQDGLLTRLDLAFSRDQPQKIYVQDKMYAESLQLFTWLEQGAYFFVCGDAYRMAKDVDKALHDIIAQQGNKTAAAAIDYVNQLKKQKRYIRDVY
jgi:sulfite reductase (NADPH) flavoprotein alpha-component